MDRSQHVGEFLPQLHRSDSGLVALTGVRLLHMMTRSHQTGLAFIAGFKVVKGLLLLLVGLGLLKLVHAEIATLFSLLIEALHLNADSRIVHTLVLKVDALQPHGVRVMGVISLGYAGLLLV